MQTVKADVDICFGELEKKATWSNEEMVQKSELYLMLAAWMETKGRFGEAAEAAHNAVEANPSNEKLTVEMGC